MLGYQQTESRAAKISDSPDLDYGRDASARRFLPSHGKPRNGGLSARQPGGQRCLTLGRRLIRGRTHPHSSGRVGSLLFRGKLFTTSRYTSSDEKTGYIWFLLYRMRGESQELSTSSVSLRLTAPPHRGSHPLRRDNPSGAARQLPLTRGALGRRCFVIMSTICCAV